MATLTQYTQVLSKPGETFTYRVIVLCPACAARMSDLSKMGGVYGAGACEGCPAPVASSDWVEMGRDYDNLETWE